MAHQGTRGHDKRVPGTAVRSAWGPESTIPGTAGVVQPMETDVDQVHLAATETPNMTALLQALDQLSVEYGPAKEALQALRDEAKTQASGKLHTEARQKIQQLTRENKNLDADKARLERDNKDCQKQLKDLKEETRKLEQYLRTADRNQKSLESQLHDEKEKTKDIHRQNMRILADENEGLKKMIRGLEDQVKQKDEERRKANKDLSECKSRLSKLMGDKLSDNNPDIADLSDQNRPTKLGERFAELYDNEWTDAYETLEGMRIGDERFCIDFLNRILTDAFQFCVKLSDEQTNELHKIAKMSGSELQTSEQLSDLEKKQVKEVKKRIAEMSTQNVYKRYKKETRTSSDDLWRRVIIKDKVELFAKECVRLCWLMSVQDPPVVIGGTSGSSGRFDNNLFRAYTETGAYMDYIVWPPLHLHAGGPLLVKGIAQGRNEDGNLKPGQVSTTDTGTTNKHATGQQAQSPNHNYDDVVANQRQRGNKNQFTTTYNPSRQFPTNQPDLNNEQSRMASSLRSTGQTGHSASYNWQQGQGQTPVHGNMSDQLLSKQNIQHALQQQQSQQQAVPAGFVNQTKQQLQQREDGANTQGSRYEQPSAAYAQGQPQYGHHGGSYSRPDHQAQQESIANAGQAPAIQAQLTETDMNLFRLYYSRQRYDEALEKLGEEKYQLCVKLFCRH